MDYKDTINLLEPKFPMRGDLVKREPEKLKKLEGRYKKLREVCSGRDKFILHDGPPYANGNLHVGHAQNKVLKDIIIRSKTIAGFDAPFVPGWDCHGLPIEINIEKKFGKNIAPKEVREKSRVYAETQIEAQKLDFKRLGVIGDWDNPYKTMNFKIEADTVRALGEIYKNGYLNRGVKPVHWCIDCGSALAEAEVEYADKESPAIDVAFLAEDTNAVAKQFNVEVAADKPVFAVIWTTTPWTLPANQAICAGPEVEYALVDCGCSYIIIAKNLVDSVIERYSFITEHKVASVVSGEKLELLKFKHPFYNRTVPMILGDHATDDSGTGLVHTAPAHGMDDYLVGLKYNLSLDNPVGPNGCYISTTELFAGLHVFKANDVVIETLEKNQRLMAKSNLTHSYPCCWRHKSKIIYRTTSQWFIMMDKAGNTGKSLRQFAGDAIDTTAFYPAWGKNRLVAMIKDRPDWCVSRQRNWGSPLAFFAHKETGELHPDSYNLLQKVAKLIEEKGIDGWFDLKVEEILEKPDQALYAKLPDTLDVWFDSGVTHYSVLKQRPELATIADLYLEGSDQHRGWFQSSLLTSSAINGHAPYKQLLTHAFVVDGNGYKMSKSKGNVVSLVDAVNKFGADILRLWVASTNYTDDVSFSDEILKRNAESYRRLRNTLRFLLANLVDFDIKKDAVNIDDLVEVDKYALIMLTNLQNRIVNELYPSYQFHLIVQELLLFCSDDMGGFYLDILKDRLYTSKTDSKPRRSAQTVLYHITCALSLLLSPILCFTADEVWEELHNDENDSTLFHSYHQIPEIKNAAEIEARWDMVTELRSKVLKELENYRSKGEIGSSLQAELTLEVNSELYKTLNTVNGDLKFAYMVSKLELKELASGSEDIIVVRPSEQEKCERCWHYSATVGLDHNHKTICDRCITNVEGAGEIRLFA